MAYTLTQMAYAVLRGSYEILFLLASMQLLCRVSKISGIGFLPSSLGSVQKQLYNNIMVADVFWLRVLHIPLPTWQPNTECATLSVLH